MEKAILAGFIIGILAILLDSFVNNRDDPN